MADYMLELEAEKRKIEEQIELLEEAEKTIVYLETEMSKVICPAISQCYSYYEMNKDWTGYKKNDILQRTANLNETGYSKWSAISDYGEAITDKRKDLEDKLDNICDDITDLENVDIEENNNWIVGKAKVVWNEAGNFWEKLTN